MSQYKNVAKPCEVWCIYYINLNYIIYRNLVVNPSLIQFLLILGFWRPATSYKPIIWHGVHSLQTTSAVVYSHYCRTCPPACSWMWMAGCTTDISLQSACSTSLSASNSPACPTGQNHNITVHSSQLVTGRLQYGQRSGLPQFEKSVLGVRADEVLMWMMYYTYHVLLMNLTTRKHTTTMTLLECFKKFNRN